MDATAMPGEVWPELLRARKAVVVVDVVESVRLMQDDEHGVIERWRRFVGEIRAHLLPARSGRLVKSLGDGLLLAFDRARDAAAASIGMQALMASQNQGLAADGVMWLRIGIHLTDVLEDELDIYGAGVNLAARLSALAAPGSIVVSAEVRDDVVDGLDADIEDLGECYVKHLQEPIRAYRLRAVGQLAGVTLARASSEPLVPGIAVVPFKLRMGEPQHAVLGDLIADSVIARLSGYPNVRVVCALSTRALADRDASTQRARAHEQLHADFLLTGTFDVLGQRIVSTADVIRVRSGESVWSAQQRAELTDLFQPESSVAHELCRGMLLTLERLEVERARTLPLPTLESFALLLGAVSLMHRATRRDFDRVQAILQHLVDRHPRLATPRAWLAKWHVLRVTRGIGADLAVEAAEALAQTQRALDSEPECSLALAMEGFVHCHMRRDLETAEQRYAQALRSNPNESMAWLFKSVLHAFQGQGEPAMSAAEKAIGLSPLDPLRYYYDSLAASAALAAQHYDQAVLLAERSLRANRAHSSTLRVLTMAQALTGRVEQARETARELLCLEPGYTVGQFLARSPSARFEIGQRCAAALRLAGVPE